MDCNCMLGFQCVACWCGVSARSVREPERMYHVVAIGEWTGRKTYLTATPVTHHEGCTIISKFYPRPANAPRHVRIQLEECP